MNKKANVPRDGHNTRDARDEQKETFLTTLKRRYACKLYDSERVLSDADVDYILECARLSPSSFGIEHWHLYAVRSRDVIGRLRSACFDQDAVGTASLVVVALARRAWAYDPEGAFIAERGGRFPGGLSVFREDFRGYYEFLETNGLTDQWARAQCYIACANMMTGAAAADIDSCAIEGYDDGAVLSVLGLDPKKWETGIVTVFGYSAEEAPREKIRMNASEIVTYV
ncbi:MAG TPA: NAD(P)H-dependent oxidoreductase [Treponemataceae bacterium]|nr:NAD(P)H-dependent oxidoreductase [Treponemataceae bacterium]